MSKSKKIEKIWETTPLFKIYDVIRVYNKFMTGENIKKGKGFIDDNVVVVEAYIDNIFSKFKDSNYFFNQNEFKEYFKEEQEEIKKKFGNEMTIGPKDYRDIICKIIAKLILEKEKYSDFIKNIYNDSKNIFSEYYNQNQPFISEAAEEARKKKEPQQCNWGKLKNTVAVQRCLKDMDEVKISNDKNLNFFYINRELSPYRTEGAGQKSSGRFGIDLIGWNTGGNNNKNAGLVFCEIKVGSDFNLFFALIQLLTYSSAMMTDNQIQRLKNGQDNKDTLFEKKENFLKDLREIEKPKAYLYILLVNFIPPTIKKLDKNKYNTSVKKDILESTLKIIEDLKNKLKDEFLDIAVLKLDNGKPEINKVDWNCNNFLDTQLRH